MLVTFLRLGLFGLVLLRLRLLMPIGFQVGPPPNRGLVLGRGRERFRVVRLGGHEVRKVVLLMRMMPLTFSCSAILLLLPCLT